jgi:hypothetical protein
MFTGFGLKFTDFGGWKRGLKDLKIERLKDFLN